jgi:hypothetical protein
MRNNSSQVDTVTPSVQSEALKNNQFHINEVPAGSWLLIGDAPCSTSPVISVPQRLNAPISRAL